MTRKLGVWRHEIRHGLLPGIVDEFVEARRFSRRHGDRKGSLHRYRAAKQARLHLIPPEVRLEHGLIVDLGANVGDWTAAVLEVVPSTEVIAVEPAPEPRAELAARFASDERVTIEQRAVGDRVGRSQLHVTEHSHATSLREPLAGIGDLYPGGGWSVRERMEVDVTTVDQIVRGRKVTLLKIDVQGSELGVLTGATETLKSTDSLLLEVTFISHYAGDATFPVLHERVSAAGFELVALSDPWMAPTGAIMWMDACYRRQHMLTPLGGESRRKHLG